MKQEKNKRFRIPAGTWLMLIAAVALLGTSSVQSARAALTYYSETYDAQVDMKDIGITLVENGTDVSWRDYTQRDDKWTESTGALLQNMLAEGEKLQLGKTYEEKLTVRNSGNIDEYVRVQVYCYWLDKDGNKLTTLSPKLIDLNLLTGGDTGWVEDTGAATAERSTLYYTSILPVGAATLPFSDTLTIDSRLAHKVTQTQAVADGKTTITTTYDYDGITFQIEAQADAVQTHNAADAIKSAWGVNVSIDDSGRLSLQ